MYLWLKKGSEQQAVALKFSVEKDKFSGESFIHYNSDACDPSKASLCQELANLVEKVTLKEIICRGPQYDGIYRRDGCELTAITRISCGFDQTESQDVNISGPTVEAIDNIYSLFRESKLGEPDVNWEPTDARPTKNSEACEILTEILEELRRLNCGVHELTLRP